MALRAIAEEMELAEMIHNIKSDRHRNGNGTVLTEDVKEEEADQFDLYVGFIEKSAFAVFFLLFVIYNVIYWTWLFNSSAYYDLAKVNTTLNVADTEDPNST